MWQSKFKYFDHLNIDADDNAIAMVSHVCSKLACAFNRSSPIKFHALYHRSEQKEPKSDRLQQQSSRKRIRQLS